MKSLGSKYKCYYRKMVLNTITNKMEVKNKTIVIFAKNKDVAIKCCEFEVGIKPYKIKSLKWGDLWV